VAGKTSHNKAKKSPSFLRNQIAFLKTCIAVVGLGEMPGKNTAKTKAAAAVRRKLERELSRQKLELKKAA